ncbi:fungal-specific transcription factor domain-containing protein [Phascolomyces articulosus]|uniref:Fungal-specific transcription factor domain-containing protein n=1 Tax=Phascolomyces articulosus TaxID=60185 RepID=A0AAD5K188_9FUNG|nr:fungal-specific transcription factor domain-containing protein [Phascolomyces articulosus]
MENTLFPLQQQQTLQTVTDIPKIRNASTIRNRNNAKVKRDRNSKSCDNCRKRKVRCNANIQSPCNYCVKDGIECQFLSTRKKMGPPSRRYTDSLEKRVQMLEKLLDEERNNSRNKEVVQSAYNLPIQPSTVTYVNNHNAVFSCPIQYQSSIPTIFLPTASPSLSPASIIELSQDLRDDSRDYIFDLIQEIPGLTLNLTEYMIESCFTGFTHSGSLAINKYEFLTQYYYQYPRPLDKYLFYAVCAVGCHLLPIHLKNQKAIPIMGRLLRKKAMGVMTQSYTRSNITTVETMIILSLLAPGSESSEGSSTSWLILGAAIRMGQDMGLLYDANLENLSRCEIQNRRRIAYALYTLDKFFSAACGKPFVIRDDDFNVELPLLYEIEPDNGFIANRPLPRLLEQSERDIREARPIYNEIAQLYSMARTICRILMTFYVPNPIPNSGFGSDLDTNLIEWQTKVETSIADKETGKMIKRKKEIITSRLNLNNFFFRYTTGSLCGRFIITIPAIHRKNHEREK